MKHNCNLKGRRGGKSVLMNWGQRDEQAWMRILVKHKCNYNKWVHIFDLIKYTVIKTKFKRNVKFKLLSHHREASALPARATPREGTCFQRSSTNLFTTLPKLTEADFPYSRVSSAQLYQTAAFQIQKSICIYTLFYCCCVLPTAHCCVAFSFKFRIDPKWNGPVVFL